jgi:hypothetical protein
VGAHSKARHRSIKATSRVFTTAGPLPWTRRYPAVTFAALAGTVIGAPGGIAAAMSITGGLAATGLPALGPAPKVAVGPVVVLPGTGLTHATATPSASASPTASPSPSATTPGYPFAGVTDAELEPTGLYGDQSTMNLDNDQWENAVTIVEVTDEQGLSPYAAVIALSTAMQESSLQNLTTATNADSLGLFQQRPSEGWGTPDQITDPDYATRAFLSALLTYAPSYQTMDVWEAAQAVQRSGFPTAYAQWQAQAVQIVLAISTGQAPVPVPAATGSAAPMPSVPPEGSASASASTSASPSPSAS